MNVKQKILELAKAGFSEIVEIRRHLHQHPELSYEEKETGKFVAQKLSQLNIPYQHGIADNGVVALIHGKNADRKVIALRADMDALPIQEANDISYKSKNEGIMHACGHDVHTASLLGTAKILNTIKNELQGTVKLIFQPGEEKLPGGASIMIKEGVLENPNPVSIFGQHVHPPLEVGKVGVKGGMYMASADEIFLTVKGKGGHGALPQDCIDPIVITAQIITAVQQVISRRANPTIPTVLTFGKINSTGGATNIIPDEVKLQGTFRTMNEDWRLKAHGIITNIIEQTAQALGGTAKLEIRKGYPCLVNDPQLALNMKKYAVEYLGAENVIDLPIRMTAEDFSYYTQNMPGCFYRLGTGNKAKGITSPVHTNTFNVDEASLELSTGLMAWVAYNELKSA